MVVELVARHPILDCAHTLRTVLDAVADLPATYLRTADKAEALVELSKACAQIEELQLRLLAAADDVADAAGARDAGTWLAHATHLDSRAARSDLLLAQALDEKFTVVAAGMRSGAVNAPQARVIVRALEALPDDLDPTLAAAAEAHLVELAAHHDPRDLRILGKKLLEVVAPDIAEAELGKALEREEQRAKDNCVLRIKDLGNGVSRITALVPNAIAARLATYVDAEDSPRVTRARSRGEAFCRLLENLNPKLLPEHGGDATHVVVTIPFETLTNALGSATIDAGIDGHHFISAAEARRLACTAKIIPAVLGSKGEVLDLGRARRLYTSPQRRAMRLRDQRCRAEGCTIPATWCEAHHLHPWSRGGRTDLADGTLLCSHHHHRAHDTRYEMTKLPTGDYRFHRRN